MGSNLLLKAASITKYIKMNVQGTARRERLQNRVLTLHLLRLLQLLPLSYAVTSCQHRTNLATAICLLLPNSLSYRRIKSKKRQRA